MSVYSEDPDGGDPRTGLAPVPDDEVSAARERATAARYAAIDRHAMAEEVRTLIWCALRTEARRLAATADGRDDAERCADLARMVRTLRDPIPLAAVLGLT